MNAQLTPLIINVHFFNRQFSSHPRISFPLLKQFLIQLLTTPTDNRIQSEVKFCDLPSTTDSHARKYPHIRSYGRHKQLYDNDNDSSDSFIHSFILSSTRSAAKPTTHEQ